VDVLQRDDGLARLLLRGQDGGPPVPDQVNVIGSVGVPDLLIVTDWGFSALVALVISTVCPGSTMFAAAWTVQNGSACVPGPLSLHVPLKSTYSVVPGAEAAARPTATWAASAEGITATPPIMRTDAAAPASPPEKRTRRRL
jgi:hypothetical protein